FPHYPKETFVEKDGLTEKVRSREDYIAKIGAKAELPWRVLMVADSELSYLENDLIYKLATPSKVEDTSWIKPGKIACDWLNNWNVFGVDFESGVNNVTY